MTQGSWGHNTGASRFCLDRSLVVSWSPEYDDGVAVDSCNDQVYILLCNWWNAAVSDSMLRAPVRMTLPLGKTVAFIFFDLPRCPIRKPQNCDESYMAWGANTLPSSLIFMGWPREKVLATLCTRNEFSLRRFLSLPRARAMPLFVLLRANIASPTVFVPTQIMYPLDEIMHVAFGTRIWWTSVNFRVLRTCLTQPT